MAATTRVRIRVTGTVQGVGFRPFVHRLADELGLAGFVRNDERGAVIAPAAGLKQRRWPHGAERVVFLLDHLLFGLVLNELRERPRE